MSTKTNVSLEELIDIMDDENPAFSPDIEEPKKVPQDNLDDDTTIKDSTDDSEDGDTDYSDDDSDDGSDDESNDDSSNSTFTTDDEDEDTNIYTQHYQILKESGLVFEEDEAQPFDGSPDALAKVIEKTREEIWDKTAEALWSSLPEDFKPLLEYALSGGKDVTKFLTTVKPKTELTKLDVTQAEDQKEILKQYYKRTTKYTDERINKLIDKAALTDTLYEDATEAYEELKELYEADVKQIAIEEQRAQQEKEQKEAQLRKVYSETIDKVEFIPKERKNKVKAYLFNVQVYDEEPDTQFNRTLKLISNNPEHLVQLADVLMSYDPKKGLTLDRIAKVEATKATKSLKDKLQAITQPTKKLLGGTPRKSSGDQFD